MYTNKKYSRQRGDVAEVIFLGDSTIKAGIIPDEICYDAYNLACPGSTALEAYYILRAYLQEHPKPRKVFLGFTPPNYDYAPPIEEDGAFPRRTLYFHFLPIKEEIKVRFVQYNLEKKSFDDLRNKIVDTFKYELLLPEKYSSACINSKFKRGEYNRSEYKRLILSKGHTFYGTKDYDDNLNHAAWSESKYFSLRPRTDYYLHEIIGLCKKNSILFFIIQPPMNEPSWRKICETGYYKEFKNCFLSLAEETALSIETDIPCYSADYFGDETHMNLRGAKRFSTEIKFKYEL